MGAAPGQHPPAYDKTRKHRRKRPGRPDYRRCCPQDRLGMVATHVSGQPKPKRPLNAKPRTAVQQSQGESVEVRILRCRTRPGNIAASGRGARTTDVAVRRTASEWAPPISELAQDQRGPLTQSPASPRSRARGQRQVPHPPARAKTRKRRCKRPGARMTGLPALLFA